MTTQEKIAAFAKKIHENNNDGHGFDHVSRVVKLAKQILATEPLADSDLVIATVYCTISMMKSSVPMLPNKNRTLQPS